MRRIEAIIRESKIKEVRESLEKTGIAGMVVKEVMGHGKQGGIVDEYAGDIIRLDTLLKAKIEITVDDREVEKAVNAIVQAAKLGYAGDGKIFIHAVRDAVRIRTGERGEEALK